MSGWAIFWIVMAFLVIIGLGVEMEKSTAGKCRKCKGNVYYSGSHCDNGKWIDIFECEECGASYIN